VRLRLPAASHMSHGVFRMVRHPLWGVVCRIPTLVVDAPAPPILGVAYLWHPCSSFRGGIVLSTPRVRVNCVWLLVEYSLGPPGRYSETLGVAPPALVGGGCNVGGLSSV
jgi:hypothetical protein